MIGMTHRDDGDPADALRAFERSHALFSERGAASRRRAASRHGWARRSGSWGGRTRAPLAWSKPSVRSARDEQDRDLATLAAQMGLILFFLGRLDDAWDRLEVALRTAERDVAPGRPVRKRSTRRRSFSSARDRPEESLALLTRSLELARRRRRPALRAPGVFRNLSNHMMELERWDDAAAYQEEGGKLAERVGFRSSWRFLQQHVGFRLAGPRAVG